MQKWTLSVQVSHRYWNTEEGPQRRERKSLLSLSYCLSLSLLSVVGHPRLPEEQSADSPFMADGGGGAGLLECWHVPIRATVLHYSISERHHSSSMCNEAPASQYPLVVVEWITCFYTKWKNISAFVGLRLISSRRSECQQMLQVLPFK